MKAFVPEFFWKIPHFLPNAQVIDALLYNLACASWDLLKKTSGPRSLSGGIWVRGRSV
jgi:hypothetical protein